MLNVEQVNADKPGNGMPADATHEDNTSTPLTYADYLRVPELLDLQTPIGPPEAHDEMLFIIVQQAQELWFKQLLYELRSVIGCLQQGELLRSVQLVDRINRIVKVAGQEVAVLETMPPQEFQRFRHVLSSSSGLESTQFRELEWASGLRDQTYVKLLDKFGYTEGLAAAWPRSLHDAFIALLSKLDDDPVSALVAVYEQPGSHPELYMLAEALSEYEALFSEWRFHHVKLVERTIGDRSAGSAGSSGAGYLGKTLGYRFFPELWEARNRLSAAHSSHQA